MQPLKHVVKIWITLWESLNSKSVPTWTLRRSVSVPNLSPEQRRLRGIQAEQLLSNELLQEAFFALQSDLLAQMAQVKLDDGPGHTRLVLALQMSKAVERQLWMLIQDGQSAMESIKMRGSRID